MLIAMAHSGRNAGVTVAEINLAFLAELIGGVQTGKSGYAYVVGPLGRLLMHSDPKISTRSVEVSNLPQVVAARAGAQLVTTGRDPQDRRLPRIPEPCAMVIFGVTGDLARKKLIPAIYDLANRGMLPPGFSLAQPL